MPRIGIDLGGTKIEGVVLDTAGDVIRRERLTTPSGDYQGTLDAVTALVLRLESESGGTCSVGIGTPGALSPRSGKLRNANSTCLNGRTIDFSQTGQSRQVPPPPIEKPFDADATCVDLAGDVAQDPDVPGRVHEIRVAVAEIPVAFRGKDPGIRLCLRGAAARFPGDDQDPEVRVQVAWADLEGLAVETVDGVALGTVSHLFATGANDVLVVRGDRERLLPFVWEQVIHSVDFGAGLIRVDWDPDF